MVEVKRRLGCAFCGLEEGVKSSFGRSREGEARVSPKKMETPTQRQKGGRKPRELKNLRLDIKYDREEKGRSRRGRRVLSYSVSYDENVNMYLEC